MNENQIVLNLLNFYNKKGINLYMIIDDPMFRNLSLDTKLSVIKTYADKLSSSTPRGITKSDVKGIIFQALMSGGMTGFTALGAALATKKLFHGGELRYGPALGTALGGAVLGAVVPTMHALNAVRARDQLGAELDAVKEDPTESNAFNVLARRNMQLRFPEKVDPGVVSIIDKVKSKAEENGKEHIIAYTKDYNEHREHAPIVPPDTSAADRHRELVDAIKSFRQAQD